MKATFLKEQGTCNGLKISHRKEDKFSEQFSGIVCHDGKMYEAVILRICRTDSRAYVCLWTMGNYAEDRPKKASAEALLSCCRG